jgi:D-amino peptidase
MNIYISVDMEGIGGISSWSEMKRDEKSAGKLMVSEINAIIQGIRMGLEEVGKKCGKIVVSDSHGGGKNFDPMDLDKQALLIRGNPRPHFMTTGLDASFDMVFLVGYHAKSCTERGVLDHTYSSVIKSLNLNGRIVGEFDLSAGMAGHFGVPVVMVSGDEALEGQVHEISPETVYVVTKQGIGRYAALHFHHEIVRTRLIDGAKNAVKMASLPKPLKFVYPIHVTVELASSDYGDAAATCPCFTRTRADEITFTAADFPTFIGYFETLQVLCWSGRDRE